MIRACFDHFFALSASIANQYIKLDGKQKKVTKNQNDHNVIVTNE